MRARRLIAAAAVTATTAGALALAGCGTQTQTSQCGWAIKNGFSQAHAVDKVFYPGTDTSHYDNDTVWFIPCNTRNYIVTADKDHGDRHDPAVAMTGAAGTVPGVQVKVWLSAVWTPNRNKAAMTDFWTYCQKYGCASDKQNDNSANFSTPGWNGMLAETFSPAVNRAVADAALDFGPDLWSNPTLKPKLAADIQKHIMAELKQSTRSQFDYFCAVGSDTEAGKPCDPVQFAVDGVDPVNGNLRAIQNQQSELEAQQNQNALRLKNAQDLYGPYANQALMQQDLLNQQQNVINSCQAAGQHCTIIVNGGATVPQGK